LKFVFHGGCNARLTPQVYQLYEIKSADILSPGPAAITEGLAQLERIVVHCAQTAG
jgi:hypothetical protein